MLLEIKRFIYRQPRWVPYGILGGVIALVLILVLLFAFGGGDTVDEPDIEVGGVVDTVEPDGVEPDVEPDVEEPDVEPDVEVPQVDDQTQLMYTNPLTGEGTESDISADRPYAVMLNNLELALPQLGVSQADIIFEIPVEGGLTRMMAIFQSMDGVGDLGSIRSARDYFVSIATGLDALYLHAGGSDGAYTAIQSLGTTAFDCVNGPYEGTLYWRDSQRSSTMGYEHSVVTSGDVVSQYMATYSHRKEHTDSFTSSFQVATEGEENGMDGVDISQMVVSFSAYKTTTFTYDETLGEYLVTEYGDFYVDGNNDEKVSVRNVLVLRTDIDPIVGDSAGRLDVRTTGSGNGLLLCDGEAMEINWSRASDSSPFQFTTEDGEVLVLGMGTTYVSIIDESYDVDLIK